MKYPLKINNIKGGNKYSCLLSKARSLMDLDIIVHELLPAPLNDHCRVLTIRDKNLVLAADSPVWAARLRFHTHQLLQQLSRHRAVKLSTVRIRVRPPDRQAVPDRRQPPRRMVASSSTALKQTAQGISDPELKTALLRLASRHHTRRT